jgi:hypothetical protein
VTSRGDTPQPLPGTDGKLSSIPFQMGTRGKIPGSHDEKAMIESKALRDHSGVQENTAWHESGATFAALPLRRGSEGRQRCPPTVQFSFAVAKGVDLSVTRRLLTVR